MKPLLLALCILINTIMCSQLFAMDDQAISLNKISRNSLKQQFMNFEQKLSRELDQDVWLFKKELEPIAYIERLHTELPEILNSERTIEKFSRVQNSYFAKTVNKLITHYGYEHYKNVTGETLAHIRQSDKDQRCPILTTLPLPLKQYVMQKAYDGMKQELVHIVLANTFDIKDIHAKIDAVAAINKTLKSFYIFNIKTHKMIFSLPHASDDNLIRFSADGSIIITTTTFSKDVTKALIALWKIETKESLMQFTYTNPIQNIFFKNNILYIFEKSGKLYSTQIDIQNKKKHTGSVIDVGMEKMSPPFTFQGQYHVDNNAILRHSFSYFLCTQAIENTSHITSLEKIYTTPFYTSTSLTNDQRNMIDQKIKNKINDISKDNKPTNTTMSLFG